MYRLLYSALSWSFCFDEKLTQLDIKHNYKKYPIFSKMDVKINEERFFEKK